jgi:tetratricopeptide (TPR) repeat protein
VLAQTPADLKVQAYQLFQQGIGQYQISQFEPALQSWQQALMFYQQIKDREGERKALGTLGLAYRALGNYAKAIDHLQQTLNIAREIKDPHSTTAFATRCRTGSTCDRSPLKDKSDHW